MSQVAKLAEIVKDMTLYPRHSVDPQHVGSLVFALEAGEKLPPIIVDKKSKRIVDGFHRYDANVRTQGPEGGIEVEYRSYPSERELILDAIRLNAAHGRRLDRMDQVRAIVMAETAGASRKDIAVALSMTEERVEVLSVRVAAVAPSSSEAVPGTAVVALKRPVRHMQGRRMTRDQAEAHRSMPGTSFTLLCDQLMKAMDADLIDREDAHLLDALRRLAVTIREYLKRAA